MTTPSKRLLFEVRLKTKEGDRPLTRFTGDLDRLEDGRFSPGLSVVENQDIGLVFHAPPDFRLTMDGLDVVQVPGADRSRGEAEIRPQERCIPLFSAKNFPLVPGYYVLTVSGRGRTWHSVVEIVPRYLEKRQWQDMRDELMGEIRRLSFDFMKRTMHIDQPLENALGLSSEMLLRFYIISDMSARVMHVMGELSRTANSRITLRTRRLPADSGKKEETRIRGGAREGNGGLYICARCPEMTWDVAENRFAKAILQDLSQSLRAFVAAVDDNAARVSAEQEEFRRFRKDYQYQMRGEALRRFTAYRARGEQLLNAVRLVEKAPWFQETETIAAPLPGQAAVQDPRYSVLHRLYRRMRHPEDSLSVSPFYRFQWKRTDKLYELWCFLTFLKALGRSGWQMEAGPAVTEDGGQYTLESLEPGTAVRMRRGDETVRLVYDAVVPDTAADTDRMTRPLYTNNGHRRPDMRIDYYRGESYGGSLVADFKYRDIYRLWNEGSNSSEIRVQFNAYRDMNTKFYRDMDETASIRNSRPVKEVWAVFPRETPPLSDEDYSLRFISLAPGLSSNESLGGLLETYFAGLMNG